MDHARFIKANADGYPIAFGEAGNLQLMETFQFAQRPTIVRYEISKTLTPTVRERYPQLIRLIRLVAVKSEKEWHRFAVLGMHPVVNRVSPKVWIWQPWY